MFGVVAFERGEVFCGWISMSYLGCESLYWIVGEV